MDSSNSKLLLQVIATCNNQQQLEDVLRNSSCSSTKPQQSSSSSDHHLYHMVNKKEVIKPSVVSSQPAAADNQQQQAAAAQHLKCPRCDSNNTKFCYYNNYSLSQPRYFCKGCRRYWTQGGSLRNVPVGGGCRKTNKRPSPTTTANSSSSSSSSNKKIHQAHQRFATNPNPNPLLIPNRLLSPLVPLTYDPNSGNGLTLPLSSRLHEPPTTSTSKQLGFDYHHQDDQLVVERASNANSILGNPSVTTTTTTTNYHNPLENYPTTTNTNNHPITCTTSSSVGGGGFLDALRNGFVETQSGFHSFQYGGFGNCNVEDLDHDEQGGHGGGEFPYLVQEITNNNTTTTTATTITTRRKEEEVCKERDDEGGEGNKVLVNLPWQIDGGVNMQGGIYNNVDSAGRGINWINGIGSSWHELVNSTTL